MNYLFESKNFLHPNQKTPRCQLIVYNLFQDRFASNLNNYSMPFLDFLVLINFIFEKIKGILPTRP
jgi:hypothetical protein